MRHSKPERWGQTLVKRRETLEAKDQSRAPRVLTAWDYLSGVQDVTRQGALRFRLASTETFISNDPLPAPPVARLQHPRRSQQRQQPHVHSSLIPNSLMILP